MECPVCHRVVPARQLQAHVNRCLDREAGVGSAGRTPPLSAENVTLIPEYRLQQKVATLHAAHATRRGMQGAVGGGASSSNRPAGTGSGGHVYLRLTAVTRRLPPTATPPAFVRLTAWFEGCRYVSAPVPWSAARPAAGEPGCTGVGAAASAPSVSCFTIPLDLEVTIPVADYFGPSPIVLDLWEKYTAGGGGGGGGGGGVDSEVHVARAMLPLRNTISTRHLGPEAHVAAVLAKIRPHAAPGGAAGMGVLSTGSGGVDISAVLSTTAATTATGADSDGDERSRFLARMLARHGVAGGAGERTDDGRGGTRMGQRGGGGPIGPWRTTTISPRGAGAGITSRGDDDDDEKHDDEDVGGDCSGAPYTGVVVGPTPRPPPSPISLGRAVDGLRLYDGLGGMARPRVGVTHPTSRPRPMPLPPMPGASARSVRHGGDRKVVEWPWHGMSRPGDRKPGSMGLLCIPSTCPTAMGTHPPPRVVADACSQLGARHTVLQGMIMPDYEEQAGWMKYGARHGTGPCVMVWRAAWDLAQRVRDACANPQPPHPGMAEDERRHVAATPHADTTTNPHASPEALHGPTSSLRSPTASTLVAAPHASSSLSPMASTTGSPQHADAGGVTPSSMKKAKLAGPAHPPPPPPPLPVRHGAWFDVQCMYVRDSDIGLEVVGGGVTTFHRAAAGGHVAVLATLLSVFGGEFALHRTSHVVETSNATLTDAPVTTPLAAPGLCCIDVACLLGHAATVKMLLSGTSLPVRVALGSGWHTLHFAVVSGSGAVVSQIMDAMKAQARQLGWALPPPGQARTMATLLQPRPSVDGGMGSSVEGGEEDAPATPLPSVANLHGMVDAWAREWRRMATACEPGGVGVEAVALAMIRGLVPTLVLPPATPSLGSGSLLAGAAPTARELTTILRPQRRGYAVYDVADAWGNTPLALACALGHADLVRMFVDAGCCLGAANVYGDTPIMLAVRGGHWPVVRLLLQAVIMAGVAPGGPLATPAPPPPDAAALEAAAAASGRCVIVRFTIQRRAGGMAGGAKLARLAAAAGSSGGGALHSPAHRSASPTHERGASAHAAAVTDVGVGSNTDASPLPLSLDASSGDVEVVAVMGLRSSLTSRTSPTTPLPGARTSWTLDAVTGGCGGRWLWLKPHRLHRCLAPLHPAACNGGGDTLLTLLLRQAAGAPTLPVADAGLIADVVQLLVDAGVPRGVDVDLAGRLVAVWPAHAHLLRSLLLLEDGRLWHAVQALPMPPSTSSMRPASRGSCREEVGIGLRPTSLTTSTTTRDGSSESPTEHGEEAWDAPLSGALMDVVTMLGWGDDRPQVRESMRRGTMAVGMGDGDDGRGHAFHRFNEAVTMYPAWAAAASQALASNPVDGVAPIVPVLVKLAALQRRMRRHHHDRMEGALRLVTHASGTSGSDEGPAEPVGMGQAPCMELRPPWAEGELIDDGDDEDGVRVDGYGHYYIPT